MRDRLADIFAAERKTIVNSSTLVLMAAASGVIIFSMNFLLSKFFGPTAFGQFKTVFSFYLSALAVFELGMSAMLQKYLAEFQGTGHVANVRSLIVRAFRFRLLLLVILTPLAVVVAPGVARIFLKDPSLTPFILAGVPFFALGLLEIARPIATGLQRFRLLGTTNVLIAFTSAAAVLSLARFFGVRGALVGLAVGFPLGSLPLLVAIVRMFRTHQPVELPPPDVRLRPILRQYSLPLYLANAPSFLYGASIPLLSIFFDSTTVGHYAFAFTFASAVPLLAGTISQVVFPKIAELTARREDAVARRKLGNVLVVYGLVAAVGAALTFLLAKPVIQTVTPVFLPSIRLLEFLVAFSFPFSAYLIVTTYLSARARLREVGLINTVASLTWLIISFLLVRWLEPLFHG